jgi:DNA-binding transcriptional MerR regulator/methylmalonyl-CoA mutase cobalamin-binding subunit
MPTTLSIAAVERDTGLSRDTLRDWERRYGFPAPTRDALGERSYPADQIEKLRLVRRLLDAGYRPGSVIALPLPDLQQLAQAGPAREADFDTTTQDQLDLICSHDAAALRRGLTAALSRLGVAGFVSEVAAPLITAVGDGWARGRLQVFEEHLFTEVMQGVLRQAIGAIPPPRHGRPRVLLATPTGEPHGLGLLMAQALLALEGCACTSLGTEVPLWDVSVAAHALASDIVALSYTGCIAPDQVVQGLAELRSRLPPATALWVGGSVPVLRRRQLPGVQVVPGLAAASAELLRWRNEHQSATADGAVPKMQA